MKTLRKFGHMKSGLEAKISPMVQSICWAAGIYEGEGSCSRDALKVTQKDRWLLDNLKLLFGGTISWQDKKDKDRHIWCWQISGPRARGFAMTIYQFLSPRRKLQLGALLRR